MRSSDILTPPNNRDIDFECRRREPRGLGCGLSVRNPVAATVLDISQNGLGLESTEPLDVRTFHDFSLEIQGTTSRVFGEVRWCHLVGTKSLPTGERVSRYRSGILFVKPS